MRVWLEKWGFLTLIQFNYCEKQQGTTIYLDDRSYRFVSWNDLES